MGEASAELVLVFKMGLYGKGKDEYLNRSILNTDGEKEFMQEEILSNNSLLEVAVLETY